MVTDSVHYRTVLVIRRCDIDVLDTPSCVIPLDIVLFDLGLHSQVPVAGRLAHHPLPLTALAYAQHLLVRGRACAALGNHHPSRFQVVGSPPGGLRRERLHRREWVPLRRDRRRLPGKIQVVRSTCAAAVVPAVGAAGSVTRRRRHQRRIRRHCAKCSSMR